MEVGGIRLDPNNYEFMQALAIAQATNNNLYLTGKAGSGKTFFLKYLKKVCRIPIKSVLCMLDKHNGFLIMDYSHVTSLLKDWGSFLNERQSNYESLLCDTSLRSLLQEKGITEFDDYNVVYKYQLSKDIPITTPLTSFIS